jgi:pyridoxal 5'-phosphate synthase pdxT subunit
LPDVDGSPPPRARVGVLSLQGDFERHSRMLEACGVSAVRVTLPEHLEGLAALVMPGGESSTMLRLLEATDLRAPIEAFVREKPVLGTCAGVILLARKADKLPASTLGALDLEASRNSYGRQIHSFVGPVSIPALGGEFPGVFIRAPRIDHFGSSVEAIARRTDEHGREEVVGVRSGHIVGITFHPELTSDLRFHRWFLTEVVGLRLPAASHQRSTEAA